MRKTKKFTDAETGKGTPHRPVNPEDSFRKSKKRKSTEKQEAGYKFTHQGRDLQNKKKSKNWIQGAIKRPGALHRELGVAEGKKIPQAKLEAAAGKGGKLGQRARLAETLENMHSKKKSMDSYKRATKGTRYC